MALAQHIDRRGVLDKLVGPTDANQGRGEVLFAEQFENSAAIAAHQDVVFQGDDDIGRTAKEFSGACINRLEETRIDDGTIKALLREFLSSITSQRLHV